MLASERTFESGANRPLAKERDPVTRSDVREELSSSWADMLTPVRENPPPRSRVLIEADIVSACGKLEYVTAAVKVGDEFPMVTVTEAVPVISHVLVGCE